jgi:hypothetical protein
MTTTDIRVALTGALLVLALAGCSAPAEGSAHAEAAPSSEASGEGEAEVLAYPPGFPTDRAPMFEGTLLHVAHPGNLWAAWIESKDLVADLTTAIALLTDAGFTVTASADGYADLTDGERNVRIIATDDATYGPCLAYTITDGAIEPEDAQDQDSGESDH